MMRYLFSTLLVGLLAAFNSQSLISGQPVPEVQLSPQDAYEHAIRPLEITRRAPQNWSDVELKALKVARENAKAECAARNPERFAGADLVALARLCAFALQWETVHWAASNYISSAKDVTTAENSKDWVDLATAFDYKIQASLNLKNLDEAAADCQVMVRRVPYNLFASEATNSVVSALGATHTDVALAILAQRQPKILSLIGVLRSSGSAAAGTQALTANSPPPLPLYSLYADAIALPSLQQFDNQEMAAASSLTQLEASLPTAPSANDALYIDQLRRQYNLLGRHLPALNPMGSLLFPGAAAPEKIDSSFASGTVFLLFPDWCNQCIAMGPDATQKSRELVSHQKIRFFLLMAQAKPPEKPEPAPALKTIPLSTKAAKAAVDQGQQLHFDQQAKVTSDPDKLLLGTPTVSVPNEILNTFAASDFPLLIATDHNGIVRWIGRTQDNALDSDGQIDQIITHILATWPPK